MDINTGIHPLAEAFELGSIIRIKAIEGGLINSSFDLATSKGHFFVQRINTDVFASVPLLMDNIELVTSFLKSQGQSTIEFIKAADGKLYSYIDDKAWRVARFIEDSMSLKECGLDRLEKVGYCFGAFDKALLGLDPRSLNITIEHFHDPLYRLNRFKSTLCGVDHSHVGNEVDTILRLEGLASQIGDLPCRVNHNDAKIANVLFDSSTLLPKCIIDLDTVMPGYICYDYGDAVRTIANRACEDEKDLSKVGLDLDSFRAFSKGFLTCLKTSLTPEEKGSMVAGALVITYEQAIRFLDDYLKGNVYYRTSYPSHNLDRCRCQLAFLSSMLEQRQRLEDEVARYQ